MKGVTPLAKTSGVMSAVSRQPSAVSRQPSAVSRWPRYANG
ncbi:MULTISPECIES: hypothetical protein [Moorena]|nr:MULTISPECIES: hypothetical protein [Moorena]